LITALYYRACYKKRSVSRSAVSRLVSWFVKQKQDVNA